MSVVGPLARVVSLVWLFFGSTHASASRPLVWACELLAVAHRPPRCKTELPPLPLVLIQGAADQQENAGPNVAAMIASLVTAVKARFKYDLKDAFVFWSPSAEEQSSRALVEVIEGLCSSFYQSLELRKKTNIRELMKSVTEKDVRAVVRKSFSAGLFCEFRRQTDEALAHYEEGYQHLRRYVVAGGFNHDELIRAVVSGCHLTFKIWSLHLGANRYQELCASFYQYLHYFCMPSRRGSPPNVQLWLLEWRANVFVLLGDLLRHKRGAVPAGLAREHHAFFYFTEAAARLQQARSLAQRHQLPSLIEYGKRILELLELAYHLCRCPQPVRRWKQYVGAMMAEENRLQGPHILLLPFPAFASHFPISAMKATAKWRWRFASASLPRPCTRQSSGGRCWAAWM